MFIISLFEFVLADAGLLATFNGLEAVTILFAGVGGGADFESDRGFHYCVLLKFIYRLFTETTVAKTDCNLFSHSQVIADVAARADALGFASNGVLSESGSLDEITPHFVGLALYGGGSNGSYHFHYPP
jgi:hypothetical protein